MAATFAIGKPVAFEASAEERDTRGFISITTMRPSAGLTPNCTLEPPVSTPISRSTASEASRMIWYSLSVSVSAGATVMESPVCTPIGSRFSIEQMMMQLSFLSRTTSISNSFQPSTRFLDQDFVGRGGVDAALDDLDEFGLGVGDAAAGAAHGEGGADDRGQADIVERAQRVGQVLGLDRARRLQPDPGHGLAEAAAVFGLVDGVGGGADHLDVEFSSVPCLRSDSAQFSAVCPPMVGSSAKPPGTTWRSFSMILATISGVIGSI